MKIDTTFRSTEAEMMDDFTLSGEMLVDALQKIAIINRILGGNRITIDGVKKLIANEPDREFSIIDIGCGNGDMLRELDDFALRNNLNFKLTGIDANPATIQNAKELSDQSRISFRTLDIFSSEFESQKCDIILCTLTLHHFSDEQILALLQQFKKMALVGIVINDLQRSKVAYKLFKLICAIFSLNQMSREDGLVSILRGFKKQDLLEYCQKAGISKYLIKWRWAFRYQWIIFNK